MVSVGTVGCRDDTSLAMAIANWQNKSNDLSVLFIHVQCIVIFLFFPFLYLANITLVAASYSYFWHCDLDFFYIYLIFTFPKFFSEINYYLVILFGNLAS